MRPLAWCVLLILPIRVSSQIFIPTGSMHQPRAEHTATLLANGTVLVAGGTTTGGVATNTAEIYNPATGAWRYTLYPMNVARLLHTATLLPDGRVLIAAGGNTCCSLTSAEIFDPVTEQFTLTGSLSSARHASVAVPLNDGRVLAVSGSSTVNFFATPTVEVFNPIGGTWSPAAAHPTGVTLHQALRLPDGNVFVSGGYDGYNLFAHASVHAYNPISNSWIARAPMLVARVDHRTALLQDGRILIIAGADSSHNTINSVEIYDPTAGVNGQSQFGPALSTNRRRHTATLLPDGRVLVIGGGYHTYGSSETWLSSAESLYPSASGWNSAGSMASTRGYHTSTLLPSGAVLVAGGFNNQYLNAAELWARPVAVVEEPINLDGSSVFNGNRGVVPVKFSLLINGVRTCSLPAATIALVRTAGGTPGYINESEYGTPADSGSDFRIADCKYIFNVGPRNLGAGTYQVQILLGGAVAGTATFGLR